eukprot:3311985-Pyramimonas_sp.AAC.1
MQCPEESCSIAAGDVREVRESGGRAGGELGEEGLEEEVQLPEDEADEVLVLCSEPASSLRWRGDERGATCSGRSSACGGCRRSCCANRPPLLLRSGLPMPCTSE